MRVLDICKNYGIVAPEFVEVAGGFEVTLFKEKLKNGKTAPKTAPKTSTIILREISNNENITVLELMKLVRKSRRTVMNHLAQLKDDKKIERVGSNKSGYWKIIEE